MITKWKEKEKLTPNYIQKQGYTMPSAFINSEFAKS
jgi:hypothetical protein